MLSRLLGKLALRSQRHWTETEIRDLIAQGNFDQALAATDALYPTTPDLDLLRSCLQAEIAFRTHRDDDAHALYAEVLNRAPGFADAHHGLSLLKQAQGDFDSAFQHALFACGAAPNDPRYMAQLGLCHLCVGNYPQAEELLRRTLYHAPADKTAWNNLGIALLSKARSTEARSCFMNALKLDPAFSQARQNLEQLDTDTGQTEADPVAAPEAVAVLNHFLEGSDDMPTLQPSAEALDQPWWTEWEALRELATQGHRDQAFQGTERLLLAHPDAAELAVLADRLYRALGEADSGLAVLQAFLLHHPDSGVAHQGMGEAMMQFAEHLTAEVHFKRAMALGQDNESLHKALAKALIRQDRFAEALPLYQSCQHRWPSDINFAYVGMGHYHICDYATALACFDELRTKDLIERFGLQAMYAVTLAYVGRIEEARRLMDEQIERQGNALHLRMSLASMQLLMEEFGPGWDGYRYRQLGLRSFRVLPVPEWQGDDLTGKTIVVLAEQGLGDQIMFASCLPDLLALKPARVVVEVITRVAPTLIRSFPDCEFIASRQDKKLDWLREIQGVDCFVPLGDLPRHFRRNLASFPRQAYLRPAPERVRYWRERLESLGPGPYLGTSWRGGTELTRTFIRSLSPALLAPLTQALPSQWISLQYGDVREALGVAAAAGVHLTHWSEAIADLDEFAALIAALDGVITVCNTTVHYSGAVGQRTLVLAPTVPEWRYGLYNREMPWYPHVEILRQPAPGQWEALIEVARQRLLDIFCPEK